MFMECQAEQRNILSYVEQRLDEIQAVEILDLKTAYDMIGVVSANRRNFRGGHYSINSYG